MKRKIQEGPRISKPGQGLGHPPLQVSDNMGCGRPSGVLGILPLLAITEALEEAWKREAVCEVVNERENGSANDLDDMFSLCFQPLLQHPGEGTELHVHIQESDL
jgi:hypothetical protein